MTRKLIVDVCGTLYDENTTAGFVRFVARAGIIGKPVRFWLLERLRLLPTRKLIIILGSAFGRDIFREGYISCLAGVAREALENQATAYAEYLQNCREIDPIAKRLKQFESEGWEPILVSNSLDVVISAIAKQWGYRWLASELHWHNDICLGRLLRDIKGKKFHAFKTAFSTHPSQQLAVITDNRSDADLIRASDIKVLVAAGKQKYWMKQYDSEQIYY